MRIVGQLDGRAGAADHVFDAAEHVRSSRRGAPLDDERRLIGKLRLWRPRCRGVHRVRDRFCVDPFLLRCAAFADIPAQWLGLRILQLDAQRRGGAVRRVVGAARVDRRPVVALHTGHPLIGRGRRGRVRHQFARERRFR